MANEEEESLARLIESLSLGGSRGDEQEPWEARHHADANLDNARFRVSHITDQLQSRANLFAEKGLFPEAARLKEEADRFEELSRDEVASKDYLSSIYLWMTYAEGIEGIERELGEHGVDLLEVAATLRNGQGTVPASVEPYLWSVFLGTAYVEGLAQVQQELREKGLSLAAVRELLTD